MEGHQFLTSIGILHRDISENNVVLGLYPWEERGYLIDFDMAILQDAEEPTSISSPCAGSDNDDDDDSLGNAEQSSTTAAKPEEKNPVKALRTVSTFINISHCHHLTSC